MEGVRPMKPEEGKWLGFTDELWKTVEQCWLEDRDARPSAEDVLSSLDKAMLFGWIRTASL